MDNSSATSNKQQAFTPKPVDLSQLFWRYFSHWPWFLLTIALGLAFSYLYLRYTTPVHSASVKILVKDENTSGQLSEEAVFEDMGLGGPTRNLENEIEILSSSYLMGLVAERLNLQYRFIKQGQVRDVDLYNTSGMRVLNWQGKDTAAPGSLRAILNQTDRINYELISDGKTYKAQFGKALLLPGGWLTLGRREVGDSILAEDIIIEIMPAGTRGASLASRLTILPLGKRSTVLKLSLTDESVERAKDVLQELVMVYNETQVTDKNLVLENTVNFINERLNILTNELSTVEGDVARFKSSNSVVDLGEAGTLIMGEVAASTRETTGMEVQLEILRGIEETLNRNPTKFEFVPTNTGISNLSLTGLIASFNQLLFEGEKAKQDLGPNHPTIKIIEQQAANLRTNILSNIQSIRRDLEVTRNSLRSREQNLSSRLRSLPSKERQLIEIQRQQSIKQNLYLYLLQKREESALNLAIAVAGTRIVEPPTETGLLKPKSNNIWTLGFLFGFLLPIAVISIADLLNNKVRKEDDIKKNTIVPILGAITLAKGSGTVAVTEKSRTATSEMFRLLRANLQFVGEGIHNKAILVTSSVSGEGKSFVSLNLGITLAIAGHRVLLLELDMRKPKLAKYLEKSGNQHPGITQYLVDNAMEWPAIIQQTGLHDNLFFAACGSLPPNPSELLLGERLQQLVQMLKKEYDFIIMDTPPVGLVSDALLLNKIADTSFFVVRQKTTDQNNLKIIDDIRENEKLPRPYIIFNAVKTAGGKYGSGYGYGNGYGYYDDEKPSKIK